MLFCEGLKEGKEIGQMLLKFLDVVRKNLDRNHEHIDLGLRAVKFIAKTIGHSAREHGCTDEKQIAAQVCLDVFYFHLTNELRPYLKQMIDQAFGYVEVNVDEAIVRLGGADEVVVVTAGVA